ncbi:hypothetical protein [Methylobacterium sp. J-070]|nr:hypothetical protein [Methylobacterium sp. J-070]MCJ2050325.1 hypothetical protein [Methylobacterium sp. J-070]
MLARIVNALFLRALRAPACGWVVRAAIVLASRDASPRSGAGAMAAVR